MSVGEVSAELDRLRRRLLLHRDQTRSAIESAAGIGRLLTGIAGRSGHSLMADAQRRLAEATARLVDAQGELSRAADAIGEYRAEITGGSSTPTQLQESASADETEHSPSTPGWVTDACPDLPDRPAGKGPTTGLAFDSAGNRLFGGAIASGRDIASTAGLRPVTPSGKGWPWTLTDHVEAAVAAGMRAPGGPRDVTLVLNNAPCTDDPYGCDRLLRHMIPVGSRIRVYVKPADPAQPVQHFGTYEGTGRLIQP